MGLSESFLKGPNFLPCGNPHQQMKLLPRGTGFVQAVGEGRVCRSLVPRVHESAVWAPACDSAVERMLQC